ncbi:CACTA en-spm transposon protein [Cucumis melo var. makuwa]|uniref:CACTA en-spm transposon protein n=1 Tax=Cucumis melo var. makuwa TaxID=1194695 RepID=A0A5D3CX02_CUCMM|nr:CACTA en-spm transposon protein [Cucumis melo var. makuwa]
MFGMLNDLQAPIEQEEETEDCHLEDEIPMNVGEGSTDMRWYRDKRVETDDVLRHLADVEGWKYFDSEYPDFASDSRNVRLGLASNEFNLFGQFFQLYAILLWMINDFSTCDDLLGWSIKRYQACPMCMGDRSSFGIRGRISFMGHRRYLSENHVWRRSRLHNGQVERRALLVVMNEYEIWMYLIERSLRTLKQYVRNKARPEGSIAEEYVMNESNTFCSCYLSGIETQFTRDERNDDTIVEDELLELRESANLFDDFFSLAMEPSFDVRCYNGCIVGDLRFHTSKLDSRRTTQNSGVMIIGESDASGSGDNNFYGVLDEVLHVQYPLRRNVWQFKCRWYDTDLNKSQRTHVELGYKSLNSSRFWTDVDSTIVERPIVRHVTNEFIDDVDEHLSHANIMSYQRNNFLETDTMFLEFEDDLDNLAGGSSFVGDNADESSSQPLATPTPKRRTQSRLLELERHFAINGRIPMTIAPGAEKSILPHVVRFNQAIGMCVRKTFSVRCLKWADDQAMNKFVEHQMLTTFKEFRTDCHRHFKKYSYPTEARANPPNILVGCHED